MGICLWVPRVDWWGWPGGGKEGGQETGVIRRRGRERERRREIERNRGAGRQREESFQGSEKEGAAGGNEGPKRSLR